MFEIINLMRWYALILRSDIGALAKKSNDNALSLVLKIANE